ncbi:MAG: DUF3179 domain-containing protein [Hyphomicrobiales bacterium]|nr:DUF3179 domain-containing protein [Hyphomicrobiales bacterium]
MKKPILLAGAILALFSFVALADARIDRFKRQGWGETDFTQISIPLDEILSGGPPKDGIPSIDRPIFKPLAEITDIADREPVVSLEINGDARTYPIRVLTWHEIVNDTVGGKPVTVTYCPLCNAAIVFERTVNGKELDFGTTGLLRNSDLVMYDRQTQSWWQQFTGEAIVGDMLGTKLTLVPARLEAFNLFKTRHPGGKVLVPNNPAMRSYGANPYAGYDTTKAPFLYRGDLPTDINPMARVVVVRQGDKQLVYALELLTNKGEITNGDIVFRWQKGQASALDTRSIAKGREVGNVTVQRRTSSGLKDLPYDVTFAFVVKAFHPEAQIIKK